MWSTQLAVATIILWSSCATSVDSKSSRIKTYTPLYEDELKDLDRAAHRLNVHWEDEMSIRSLWLELDLAKTRLRHPPPGSTEGRLQNIDKIIQAYGQAGMEFQLVAIHRDLTRSAASSKDRTEREWAKALGENVPANEGAIELEVNTKIRDRLEKARATLERADSLYFGPSN